PQHAPGERIPLLMRGPVDGVTLRHPRTVPHTPAGPPVVARTRAPRAGRLVERARPVSSGTARPVSSAPARPVSKMQEKSGGRPAAPGRCLALTASTPAFSTLRGRVGGGDGAVQ